MRREAIAPGLGVVAVPTPTLPPATTTNAVVLGAREVAVVDPASPWPEAQEALTAALADVTVTAILLTHHHLDHVSGAEDLRRRTGAPIYAHPATAARLDFDVQGLLEEGAVWTTDAGAWQALHTPGHASGHLIFWEASQRLVVAGDLVAGEGTIVLDPPEGDLERYLQSLERLAALGARLGVPAHGPVLTEPADLARAYIAHRHARTAQVRAALGAAGVASPEALVPTIYPGLSPFIAQVAARQVLAHLQWLQGRGEVRPVDAERFELI